MRNCSYEERLKNWHDFRESLEHSSDPIFDVFNFYKEIPRVLIQTDPYDRETWPDPWELINENIYCDFCILLGMCYSLQLTDRFSGQDFEIYITQDREKSQTNYLLFVNEWCLGYDIDKPIFRKDLPNSVTVEKAYTMNSLQ